MAYFRVGLPVLGCLCSGLIFLGSAVSCGGWYNMCFVVGLGFRGFSGLVVVGGWVCFREFVDVRCLGLISRLLGSYGFEGGFPGGFE